MKTGVSPAETARVLAQIDKATSDTAAAVERVLQTATPAYTCPGECDCGRNAYAYAIAAYARAVEARTLYGEPMTATTPESSSASHTRVIYDEFASRDWAGRVWAATWEAPPADLLRHWNGAQ